VVAADGTPLPLYYAYQLLHELIGAGADRLAIAAAPDGSFAAGNGAAVVANTAAGGTRVFVVNRDTAPHTVRVDRDGATATPSAIELFDDPAQPPHAVTPAPVVTLPPRAMMLVTL
jgi:hypothetical protein